jgi:ATP-dependent Lon protease
MVSLTLPLLPLPYPLVLLPGCGLSVLIDRSIGQALLELRQLNDAADEALNIAAVPAASAPITGGGRTPLHGWGTSARVVRMVRNPAARSSGQTYVVTLQGIGRIRVLRARDAIADKQGLGEVDVEALLSVKKPSIDSVEQFRSAALTLLARLAKDASQPAKRARWLKLAELVEEITGDGDFSVVDRLVGTLNGEFDDKLGESHVQMEPFHCN